MFLSFKAFVRLLWSFRMLRNASVCPPSGHSIWMYFLPSFHVRHDHVTGSGPWNVSKGHMLLPRWSLRSHYRIYFIPPTYLNGNTLWHGACTVWSLRGPHGRVPWSGLDMWCEQDVNFGYYKLQGFGKSVLLQCYHLSLTQALSMTSSSDVRHKG